MSSCYTRSPTAIYKSLERWSTWTQHDIDSDKATVDTVNALITVAAFIAAVQSQIILFTLELDRTPMGQATNAVAFVGIVLDVMGTFLGVIHAIVLQRRMKGKTTMLSSVAQVTTSLKAIQNLHVDSTESTSEKDLRESGIEDPEQQIRHAQQLLETLEDRFDSRNVSGPFGLAQSVFHIVFLANSAIGTREIARVDSLAKTLFGLGHTPLVAMALGVVALAVSVIMFAAESTKLSSEVWMSCVAVLGGVIALSLLPITYETAKAIWSESPTSEETLPA